MNLTRFSSSPLCHPAILLAFLTASLLPAQPTLIWADEFDVDGLPDANKWLYDVGGGGWGNQELQFYTEARSENARVENGVLIIEAREEAWPSGRNPLNDYTSARLVSKGRGDWLYGRVEVRAKLPSGAGTWPAIWMLPTGNAYGTWPRSGEIDIMEHLGREMGVVSGSLHSLQDNWLTGTYPTGSTTLPDVDTAFHNYVLEWSPGHIRILVDETEILSFSDAGTGWEAWPYDQPFYLILNLAVGGTLGGPPEAGIWPKRVEVDYVRVYDLGETVPLDTDGDGIPNATDPDDDNDGLTDVEEHGYGTNILLVDTDGDGYSDFEEIEAGTFPLLVGSFPGSNASILMINNDFAVGEAPWIVHTNKLSAEGTWTGQTGSWAGSYEVFDHITAPIGGDIEFSSYTVGDAPNAEHLVYQEWSPLSQDLLGGDVIRFRGTARATASAEGILTRAFIRILDVNFQPMAETVVAEIGPEAGDFALQTSLPETFNILQAGFVITAPQSETATIFFRDLAATINETQAMWGTWPIENDWVDTGDWIGWIHVGAAPWVWSHTLASWMYLPTEQLEAGGAWMYVIP